MNGYKVTADWIAPKGAAGDKNYYFRARRKFNLENVRAETNIHISAESFYILYINGIEAGRGPARGTHALNYYDTYNAAQYLKKGENVIAALCLCMNIETFTTAPADPALMVELEDILKTDESWEVSPACDEWKKDVQLYTRQTGFCEWRDMRKEPVGWLSRDDDVVWERAVRIAPESGVRKKKLLPRNIPLLKETEHIPVDIPIKAFVPELKDLDDIKIAKIMTEEKHYDFPAAIAVNLNDLTFAGQKNVKISPLADNGGIVLVFNFGCEIIGRFELEISAPAGTVVDIAHDEELWNNRLRPDQTDETYNFADRYILAEGRQKIGNSLVERGFRLVQVVLRNFSVPLIIHNVRAVDRRYPFSEKASFNCSDILLNRIWEVCRETISACTTDIFTDCPWRERAFWVNDFIIENLVSLQLFGDRRVSARGFEMGFSEARENGLVPGVCPCPLDNHHLILLPTNLYIPLILKDYLMYTGDSETVRKYLPNIAAILEEFEKYEDENGLITAPQKYWCFFDWSYEINEHSFNGKNSSLINYFHIIALKTYSELAGLTDVPVDKKRIERKINKISAGVESVFFDKDRKRLCDYMENGVKSGFSSQLAHALALISGKYSPEIGACLAKGLNDPKLLMPELYFHYFIFAAQKLAGSVENGLERIRKYWGNVVKTGSPTMWEAGIHEFGRKAFGGAGSLCHGFATSPIDFMQTVILGICPVKPGFREFSFNPETFDLEFAEGHVPAPSGNIEIKWRKKGTKLAVILKVPENCEAITERNGRFGPGYHEFEIGQLAGKE